MRRVFELAHMAHIICWAQPHVKSLPRQRAGNILIAMGVSLQILVFKALRK